MRVRALGLYEKVHIENKLALPILRCLLRALRPAFGFQDNVLTMMEGKIKFPSLVSVTNVALYTYYQHFSGCLLLDEMAVQKLAHYDKNFWQVIDLGTRGLGSRFGRL